MSDYVVDLNDREAYSRLLRCLNSNTLRYFTASGFTWSLVNIIKAEANQLRPNGHNLNAFPSDHSNWSVAILAAFIITQKGQVFREMVDSHPALLKMYKMSGISINLSVMVGRVLSKKHWIGDVLSGSFIGLAGSQLIENIDQIRRSYTSKKSLSKNNNIYLTDTLMNCYLITSLCMSNPPIPTYLSLGLLQGGLMISEGFLQVRKANSYQAFIKGAILRSPFALFYEKIRQKAPMGEMVMLVLPMILLAVGIGANILKLPFTMQSGTNSSEEMALYDHKNSDQMSKISEYATWLLDIFCVIIAMSLTFIIDKLEYRASQQETLFTPLLFSSRISRYSRSTLVEIAEPPLVTPSPQSEEFTSCEQSKQLPLGRLS